MNTKRKRARHSEETILKYSSTSKPPYYCKHCDYSTDNMSALVLHTGRSHTRAVPTAPQTKGPRAASGKRTASKPPGSKWDLAAAPAPAPAATGNGNGSSAVATRGRPRKLPPLLPPPAEHWHICPACGVDLELAAQAYAIAKSMREKQSS